MCEELSGGIRRDLMYFTITVIIFLCLSVKVKDKIYSIFDFT